MKPTTPKAPAPAQENNAVALDHETRAAYLRTFTDRHATCIATIEDACALAYDDSDPLSHTAQAELDALIRLTTRGFQDFADNAS